MYEQMLATMSEDLKIKRYSTETQVQFETRVLYSAIASWMKAAALDRPLAGEISKEPGVSKRHLLDTCSKVLEEYLCRFPASRTWFFSSADSEDPSFNY